jgi:hypothetical protein
MEQRAQAPRWPRRRRRSPHDTKPPSRREVAQVIDAEAAIEAAKATDRAHHCRHQRCASQARRATAACSIRVAQPGEVLAAGGRVLNLVDLSATST